MFSSENSVNSKIGYLKDCSASNFQDLTLSLFGKRDNSGTRLSDD